MPLKIKKLAFATVSALAVTGGQAYALAPIPSDQQINQQVAKNPLVNDIQDIVNFIAAGVAVVVVVMLIIAGMQYTLAGNQPQVVAAARKKIINAIFALIMLLLVYAFLQWIIPGGIFS